MSLDIRCHYYAPIQAEETVTKLVTGTIEPLHRTLTTLAQSIAPFPGDYFYIRRNIGFDRIVKFAKSREIPPKVPTIEFSLLRAELEYTKDCATHVELSAYMKWKNLEPSFKELYIWFVNVHNCIFPFFESQQVEPSLKPTTWLDWAPEESKLFKDLPSFTTHRS
jgi:hypothetical protein